MIAPVDFHVNADTLSTNSYQTHSSFSMDLPLMACREFEGFVGALIKNGVKVWVYEGASNCSSPDRIFPNNWISFHEERNVIYPMHAVNRRTERIQTIWDTLPNHYRQRDLTDWTHYEKENLFLEGTGSLVLDRLNRMAFASLSSRTFETLVMQWCEMMEYEAVVFSANAPGTDVPVYHTNVVMSVLGNCYLIGMDCVTDPHQRLRLLNCADRCKKEVLEITPQQVSEFAGNVLQFYDTQGSSCIALSKRAMASLSARQLRVLEANGSLIPVDLKYIEMFGGGSARCMLAELF